MKRPDSVKRVNARRVKIHRSYAVDEAARLLGVHKNTVRSWIKRGLPTVDNRRPILILGGASRISCALGEDVDGNPVNLASVLFSVSGTQAADSTGGTVYPDHAGVGKPSGDLRGLFDSHVSEGELGQIYRSARPA